MAHTYRLPEASGSENAQTGSLMFQLPGELRDLIYDFALTAHEDTNCKYDPNTYWARPQYQAPHKSDLALLRTCKRAYREAWFKPWFLADHSFWLTHESRAPNQALTLQRFEQALQHVHAHQGDIQIHHVRYFAQMWCLESRRGAMLQGFLDLHHFYPQTITITIRHTDWWFWEQDQPLRFAATMPSNNVFPASTRTVSLELESLERKKEQIDSIVDQMKQGWFFKRQDGVVLSAQSTSVDVQRWKGSSTWDNKRWVEDETEPGLLNYYVATVVWQHEAGFAAEEHAVPQDIFAKATKSSRRMQFATLRRCGTSMRRIRAPTATAMSTLPSVGNAEGPDAVASGRDC